MRNVWHEDSENGVLGLAGARFRHVRGPSWEKVGPWSHALGDHWESPTSHGSLMIINQSEVQANCFVQPEIVNQPLLTVDC